MTLLFTVSLTISRAWRIGTPDFISIASVLENRDSAVLWNSDPNTGARSFERVDDLAALVRLLVAAEEEPAADRPAEDDVPEALNVSDIHSRPRVGSGSVPAELTEDRLELWDDEQQHRRHDEDTRATTATG